MGSKDNELSSHPPQHLSTESCLFVFSSSVVDVDVLLVYGDQISGAGILIPGGGGSMSLVDEMDDEQADDESFQRSSAPMLAR